MRSLIFWRMAWRNLGRNLRRHLLNGSALAIGFGGMVLLGGYMIRMERYLAVQSIYLHHTGHVTIFKSEGRLRHLSQPARYSLNPDEQQLIEKTVRALRPDAEFVARVLKGTGLISNGCDSYPFIAKAVEPELERWVHDHPQVKTNVPEIGQVTGGHGFWEMAPETHPLNISSRLARLLGKKQMADATQSAVADGATLSNEVIDCKSPDRAAKIAADAGVQMLANGFHGGLAALEGVVAGHTTTGLAFSDETAMSLSLQSAQTLFNTDLVTSMAVFFKNDSGVRNFVKDLSRRLSEQGLKADVFPYTDERVSEFYVGAMNFVYVMVGFFLVLVCGIVVLAVVNSLNISLLERRSEIATLRSIGFRPKEIASIFLRENLLLSLFSFIVGGVIALVVKTAINAANIRFHIPGLAGDLQFVLQPGGGFSVFVVIVLMIAVAVATQITCVRYTRQRIVELMGHL